MTTDFGDGGDATGVVKVDKFNDRISNPHCTANPCADFG